VEFVFLRASKRCSPGSALGTSLDLVGVHWETEFNQDTKSRGREARQILRDSQHHFPNFTILCHSGSFLASFSAGFPLSPSCHIHVIAPLHQRLRLATIPTQIVTIHIKYEGSHSQNVTTIPFLRPVASRKVSASRPAWVVAACRCLRFGRKLAFEWLHSEGVAGRSADGAFGWYFVFLGRIVSIHARLGLSFKFFT
jgi:hypothetical protein